MLTVIFGLERGGGRDCGGRFFFGDESGPVGGADLGWCAADYCARQHVANDDCARFYLGFVANAAARNDACADTDRHEIADPHTAGQSHRWVQKHAAAKLIVVLDDRAGGEDRMIADRCVYANESCAPR